HVAAGPGAAHAAAPEGKPPADADALRKENELLKLNLQLTLEKILAQEAELRTLRGRAEAARGTRLMDPNREAALQALSGSRGRDAATLLQLLNKQVGAAYDLQEIQGLITSRTAPDPMQEVEAALKALREARDKDAKQRAADALERALKKLRQQLK